MFLTAFSDSETTNHLPDVVTGWRTDWLHFLRHDAPKILVILVITLVLLRLINLVTNRVMALSRRDELSGKLRSQQLRTLASIGRSVGTFLVIFLAIIEVLPLFNINIGPLLASAGVAGLAIGFGAQTLVKDVITGFFILVENQFDIGDTVKIAGVSGSVEDMRLRSTVLRDANGTLHIVPNSQITIVSNLTRDWNQINLHVAVDYAENSDLVIGMLKSVAAEMRQDREFADDLVSDIEVPGIDRVSGREVDYLITAKVRPGKQYRVSRALRLRIKDCLDKNNIRAGAPAMIYAGDLRAETKS